MAKQLNKDTRKLLSAGALVRVKATELKNREEEKMELIPVPDTKHDWEYVGESGKDGFLFRCLGTVDGDVDEEDDD